MAETAGTREIFLKLTAKSDLSAIDAAFKKLDELKKRIAGANGGKVRIEFQADGLSAAARHVRDLRKSGEETALALKKGFADAGREVDRFNSRVASAKGQHQAARVLRRHRHLIQSGVESSFRLPSERG